MKIFSLISIVVFGVFLWGCAPDRDNDFSLLPPPAIPEFTVEMVPGDSNRVVVKDLSDGNFQRLWELPGGTPKTSGRIMDTVFYSKAGEYTITLHVSKANGSGTASNAKKITILVDAPTSCNEKFSWLTGDCDPLGKCWVFTQAAGAIKVGPSYDDYSWFTSTASGLQPEQYDDRFCFTFDGLVYQNRNNGASVDPWDGYQPKPYDPGISDFTFLTGTGMNGRDQIILADDQFIGVWDADNVLDVVKLTASELIVRARLRAQDGTPLPEGWFELTFIPQ